MQVLEEIKQQERRESQIEKAVNRLSSDQLRTATKRYLQYIDSSIISAINNINLCMTHYGSAEGGKSSYKLFKKILNEYCLEPTQEQEANYKKALETKREE